ncbi:hypothetical protein C8Q74DRAFT_606058 [Fomes fomentarius]|nr:hypothetical protein C8Q74DRAFT_606058 [Fomes fomentarius]
MACKTFHLDVLIQKVVSKAPPAFFLIIVTFQLPAASSSPTIRPLDTMWPKDASLGHCAELAIFPPAPDVSNSPTAAQAMPNAPYARKTRSGAITTKNSGAYCAPWCETSPRPHTDVIPLRNLWLV